jgi:hypothetical protein
MTDNIREEDSWSVYQAKIVNLLIRGTPEDTFYILSVSPVRASNQRRDSIILNENDIGEIIEHYMFEPGRKVTGIANTELLGRLLLAYYTNNSLDRIMVGSKDYRLKKAQEKQ